MYGLLVQWIEHLTTDQEIGVRISYGLPCISERLTVYTVSGVSKYPNGD
jgi:hypothetical protein